MKIDVKVNIDRESFATLDLRPFWAGFLVACLAVILSRLNLIPQSFYRPLFPKTTQVERVDFNKEIRPLLEKKVNNFELKKTSRINVIDEEAEGLAAYSVVDLQSGELLAFKDSSVRKPIASITKVMTAVTVMDLAQSDELFTISKNAANQIPTKLGVVPGEKMTVEELLSAILLTSANDAAQIIEEGIDTKYGKGVFVKAMNEKARFIGLNNSHFDNPQGFDSRKNYSSAEDLAILTQYALKNYPLIAEIVKKDYQFLAANKNHKQFDLYNWNGLIGVYPGAMGVKIGNTDDAGETTLVVSERENKKIAVVVLGAKGITERDLAAAKLLDLGFAKIAGLEAAGVTKEQLQAKYSSWKYFN